MYIKKEILGGEFTPRKAKKVLQLKQKLKRGQRTRPPLHLLIEDWKVRAVLAGQIRREGGAAHATSWASSGGSSRRISAQKPRRSSSAPVSRSMPRLRR